MEIVRCSRCILPASLPSVELDEHGVCNHCRAYDALIAELARTREERNRNLETMVARAKQTRGAYDCMVTLSGGKDSTYALYLATKVLGVRCLCATLDNAYLSDHARTNIRNALEITGADHIMYRVNPKTMKELYGAFVHECSMFCPVCNRGIAVTLLAFTKAFQIRLVFTGHGRLASYLSIGRFPEIFEGGDLGFFRAVVEGKPMQERAGPFLMYDYQNRLDKFAKGVARLMPEGLPRRAWWSVHARMRWLLRHLGIERDWVHQTVNIYDYFDVTDDEIRSTLTEYMGWQAPTGKFEHLDCTISDLKLYADMLKFPELMRSTIKNAGRVRAGQMTREAALAIEKEQLGDRREPEALGGFLGDTGMTREEFDRHSRQWEKATPFRVGKTTSSD
ncbi:MAG: hypothetical protein JW892_03170 [Anaerolineae bacterium]|nr:hypothetical protein [Anaerolineae bacterium]